MLQAAVEEAEQELVGQTGGAVTMLSILCWDHEKDKKHTKRISGCQSELQQKKNKKMVHSIGDVNEL